MRKPVRYEHPTGFLGYGGKTAGPFIPPELNLALKVFARNKLYSL
jgi:hypothetical protein